MTIKQQIEFEPCMVGNEGHIHMCINTASVTASKNGGEIKTVGTVSSDVGCTCLVCEIDGKQYHISTLDIWKAIAAEVKG